MISLIKKEIQSFFNSVTGYLVISVFLILNGLFLWLIPGDFNLLDSGYASIDGLFMIAPWVFMFLIPAITMRMFSDEKRQGTMEFLLTKPVTDWQIILAKFGSAFTLVVFSLLPTVLYYFTIHQLGDPVGNIDTGATLGSYLGLLFLAGAYIAIGLYTSSITDNAIISFISSATLSFVFFFGFDQVAELDIFGDADLLIYNLGINEHYLSISRGVVDSRDLLYFIGLITVFAMLTRLSIQKQKWDKATRNSSITRFGLITALVVLVNVAGQFENFRIDLTSEKRYTLSDATISLIEEVQDPLFLRVYLDGDFPADFQRLQRETRQMLDEFRAYNGLIEYEFINPNAIADEGDKGELMQQLEFKGLNPITLDINRQDGRAQMLVFPGAVVSYQDKETAINLLQSQLGQSAESQINNSVQNLEYSLASALRRLVLIEKPSVALLQGHEEYDRKFLASFAADLAGTYRVEMFNIREFQVDSISGEISLAQQMRRLNAYDLLVIANPRKAFNELDRFMIDQFIMNGGKAIWLLDAVEANMDSLSYASEFLAYPRLDQIGVDDMLFKYGVRINTNLVQDYMSAGVNDRREIRPWPYFPVIMPRIEHPITKGLNAIKLEFASSMDTIYSPSVHKTPLLVTSENTKIQSTPGIVSLRTLYTDPQPSQFTSRYIPVAYLLEGRFESVFNNRITPKTNSGEQIVVRDSSRWTQQVVIADGDVIKNQLSLVNPNMPRGTPLPVGFDQYTNTQFGNGDFLLNIVDYMLDESGLITVRSRELKLRLLNKVEVEAGRTFWAILNTAVPVIFILLFGILYTWIRKRKYTQTR